MSGNIIVWIGRIVGGMIGLIVLLALAGAVYQVIGTARDERKYPPQGNLVDVGGYRLHINCMGEGGPTVVMDAMGGGWSTYWSLVAPEIAKFTRVCVYDRAGLGWSDPGPSPRTGRQIADELHTLLSKSGFPGPYVLVGHSFSGFIVRLYQSHYPQDVVGMLLIDVAHEDQFTHPEFRAYYDWVSRNNSITRGAVALGLPRLAMSSKTIPLSDSNKEILDKLIPLTPDERAMVIAGWCRSRTWKTVADETGTGILKETAAQVRATGLLGDLPLVVLTVPIGPNWMPGFPTEQLRYVWMQMQQDLLKLSSNRTHMIAEKSSHFIQFDQPELVIEAVRQLVETVRQNEKIGASGI